MGVRSFCSELECLINGYHDLSGTEKVRTHKSLLQLRGLDFGLLQDGNVRVGVFRVLETILMGRLMDKATKLFAA